MCRQVRVAAGAASGVSVTVCASHLCCMCREDTAMKQILFCSAYVAAASAAMTGAAHMSIACVCTHTHT